MATPDVLHRHPPTDRAANINAAAATATAAAATAAAAVAVD